MKNIHMLLIDPQQDFCNPDGSLFVPGADKDMEQAAKMMRRINKKTGGVGECKIAKGGIRVYGSNIQAGINVSAMTFSPVGIFAIPIATIDELSGSEKAVTYVGTSPTGTSSSYGGGDREVCELPLSPSHPVQKGGSKGIQYGVDCAAFRGEVKTVNPSGFGFHRRGFIWFIKGKDSKLQNLEKTDAYIVYMRSSSILASSYLGFNIANAGAPYFFRLKGEADIDLGSEEESGEYDATDSVISVQETTAAQDFSYVKKSASVTLYNEGGKWDFLREKQYGVNITFGWNSPDTTLSFTQKTFTGLTLGATTSETPGSEKITVKCEDYIEMLDQVPIINSPFYDGMVAFYAIKDIAKKAGITKIDRDWSDINDYFLPAGFVFSQPAMRFPATHTLLQCITNICKRYQAFVYFDENGTFWVKYVPGGIIGGGALGGTGGTKNLVIKNNFVSDPNNESGKPVIIESRDLDGTLKSTVNHIVILSLDRETRNPIVVGHAADRSRDKLGYEKPLIIHEPAYGEISVARNVAYAYGDRVFNSIKKTTFKTVGGTSAGSTKVYPLDFITLDGQEFRVTNITRSFDAAANDYTSEYTCEALGL